MLAAPPEPILMPPVPACRDKELASLLLPMAITALPVPVAAVAIFTFWVFAVAIVALPIFIVLVLVETPRSMVEVLAVRLRREFNEPMVTALRVPLLAIRTLLAVLAPAI